MRQASLGRYGFTGLVLSSKYGKKPGIHLWFILGLVEELVNQKDVTSLTMCDQYDNDIKLLGVWFKMTYDRFIVLEESEKTVFF